MHISVPVNSQMEFINATEVSPLISKCQVKVCYVGDNRNGTSFSKEVLTEMGRTLPGCPIVGFFDKEEKDFDEHNRELHIDENGSFSIIDTTKPYGFVAPDAKVWFQKFYDDNSMEHEYLVTEGYIWTDIYPESKRIISQGNNQSMEITQVDGNWTKNDFSGRDIFIVNKAFIEKLCILGENVEPCFEGAQIKSQFSLDNLEQEFEDLKNMMYSMMGELKDALSKGGSTEVMEEKETVVEVVEDFAAAEEPVIETVVEEQPEVIEEAPAEEFKSEEEEEDKKEEKDSENSEEDSEGEEADDEKKDEKKYNLEDVVEYAELQVQYDELQAQYAALVAERDGLQAELAPLKQFKADRDREDKTAMIARFSMLSDEDKLQFIENIDNYSLDEIEKELAVLCFRKNINFNLDVEEDNEVPTAFNLNSADVNLEPEVPAWVQRVKETEAQM